MKELQTQEHEDGRNWQQFFHKDAVLSYNYHRMDDTTQLFVVTSVPKNKDKDLRPVILVPGWFSQPTGWIDFTLTVSEFTKVIYIETREKNSSLLVKDKATEMSIERMSRDLQDLSVNLDVDFERAICVGSSLGGSALLHLLYESDFKPYLTVLISPNPDFELPPIVGRAVLSMPLFMIRVVKAYVKWHVLTFRIDKKKNPEQAEKYTTTFDAADPWKARRSAQQVTKFKAWDFLPKIEANVILAGASGDKLHKSERTFKVGKFIPKAKYIDFLTNLALHSADFGKFVLKLAEDKDIEELKIIESMNSEEF